MTLSSTSYFVALAATLDTPAAIYPIVADIMHCSGNTLSFPTRESVLGVVIALGTTALLVVLREFKSLLHMSRMHGFSLVRSDFGGRKSEYIFKLQPYEWAEYPPLEL